VRREAHNIVDVTVVFSSMTSFFRQARGIRAAD
jgi:hypothetical protein